MNNLALTTDCCPHEEAENQASNCYITSVLQMYAGAGAFINGVFDAATKSDEKYFITRNKNATGVFAKLQILSQVIRTHFLENTPEENGDQTYSSYQSARYQEIHEALNPDCVLKAID